MEEQERILRQYEEMKEAEKREDEFRKLAYSKETDISLHTKNSQLEIGKAYNSIIEYNNSKLREKLLDTACKIIGQMYNGILKFNYGEGYSHKWYSFRRGEIYQYRRQYHESKDSVLARLFFNKDLFVKEANLSPDNVEVLNNIFSLFDKFCRFIDRKVKNEWNEGYDLVWKIEKEDSNLMGFELSKLDIKSPLKKFYKVNIGESWRYSSSGDIINITDFKDYHNEKAGDVEKKILLHFYKNDILSLLEKEKEKRKADTKDLAQATEDLERIGSKHLILAQLGKDKKGGEDESN